MATILTLADHRSCDGTMTCTCTLCEAERARRASRNVRPPARQPWQPKAA